MIGTNCLYVLGGRQRPRVLKGEEEWHLYEAALILKIDTETHASKVCVEYKTPPEACPDHLPSILFKAGTLQDDILYACTSTEVLIYETPEFRRIGYVSLPCFNDLHHVCPTAAGTLLTASTGLDMVVECTWEGKVLREWNVLGEEPWGRFSRSVDYRKVATTKPHQSHPNFVFHIGKDIWVTRLHQKDAICLTRPDRRIDIAVQRVHDGVVTRCFIYFTTVDGKIVVVNRDTLRIEEIVDLATIDNERQEVLGWCRGLLIVDEAKLWVAFTRVRKTKFRENISWVKHAFKDIRRPTHITLYDLSAGTCLNEINLEPHGMNIVYSMFAAAGSRGGRDQSRVPSVGSAR